MAHRRPQRRPRTTQRRPRPTKDVRSSATPAQNEPRLGVLWRLGNSVRTARGPRLGRRGPRASWSSPEGLLRVRFLQAQVNRLILGFDRIWGVVALGVFRNDVGPLDDPRAVAFVPRRRGELGHLLASFLEIDR